LAAAAILALETTVEEPPMRFSSEWILTLTLWNTPVLKRADEHDPV
jgi:hypothetical protein